MLSKLNKHERILIITMLTIIIWAAGIMLVIKPNIEKSTEVSERLSSIEQEKKDLETKLASEEQLKENIKTSRKELYDTLKNFFPTTANYDVDQYLAKLWQGNGLSIKNVSISGPMATVLDYYSYQETRLSYPLGDYAKTQREGKSFNTAAQAETTGTTETKTAELCEITSVTLSVSGTQEQVRNLINALNHDEKTLLVKSVNASSDDAGIWTANIVVDFIAVDKYEQ